MPLGIISSSDFESELTNKSNDVRSSNGAQIISIERGRGIGTDNVPPAIRAFLAEEAIQGATNKELAESFKISESSVSAYKNGATSTKTYNKSNEKLKSHIDSVKSSIAKKARNRMRDALDKITEDKLELADVRTLSGVAKDMAFVMEKMEPKVVDDSGPKLAVLIYAPPQKQISDYEVIEVSPEE